jgi:hypothetical protein
MRSQLEQVQRGLTEEAQRIRGRLRGQLEQVGKLEAALAERVGSSREDVTEPVPDVQRGRLATLLALENELVGRLKQGQAKIAQAEALAPAVQRGLALLQGGQFAEAVAEFEAIVSEMPEHRRALDALTQARAQADAQRERTHVLEIVEQARTALAEGRHAICFELLEQAAAIPASAEIVPELASLREAAEAVLAEQEAAQRAEQGALRARDVMVEARRTAQAQAAAQYAPDLWNDAESRSSEAQAALARGTHAEAGPAFDAAAAAFQRAAAVAREAQLQELETAKQAREQMALGQQGAQAARAEQYARKLWDAADVKAAEAQVAFGKNALGRGIGLFNEAAVLYRRAEEAASEARQRELRRAEEARDRVAQGQRAAAAVDAEHHAPVLWKNAAAKSVGAQSDLAREQYVEAAEAFDEALVLYRQAVNQVEKTRSQQRDQAEEGRRAIAEYRSSAMAAEATLHAPSEWTEAEAIVASSDAAFAREAYAEARRGFDRAVALYRLAEERARDAMHVLETARLNAVKAAEATAMTRRTAVEAQASNYAVEEWRAGESTEAQASAALSRREYAAARSLFTESRRLYAAAAKTAAVAMETEARRADTMMSDALRLLQSGNLSDCLRQLSEVLRLKPGHAAAEALRREAEGKLRENEDAARHAAASAALQDVTVVGGQPADVLKQTIIQGETPANVPTVLAEAPVVLAEPPTILMDAPTVRAEPPTVLPDVPTVLAAGATAGWRFWRLAMGAVGGLVVVGLGVFFWLPRPAPVVSPPAPQVTTAPPVSSPAPHTIPVPAAPQVEPPAAGAAAGGAGTAALNKPEVEEAGQARLAAVKARQDAERAGAPSRAPRAFALAQQREGEAEAALKGQDAASAKLQFRRVEQRYKQAIKEAERAATEEKKRSAALHPPPSDAGQSREQAKLESEAQQQVAVLTREEAVRIEANRFAKDVFDAAQAKLAEAERLFSSRNYAAASLAFQDATARYLEATRRTQGVRADKSQAETARMRMLAEKQQADPAASDFASGLAEERQGNGLYERLAYREATERFKSAETFFTRAGAKQSPSTSPAPPKPEPVQPATKRPFSAPSRF